MLFRNLFLDSCSVNLYFDDKHQAMKGLPENDLEREWLPAERFGGIAEKDVCLVKWISVKWTLLEF